MKDRELEREQMSLIEQWAKWQPGEPPHLFDDDREILEAARTSWTVNFASWEGAYSDAKFAEPDDTRLHLGLLPQPFFGDLSNATIFVLMLNPGLGPSDYYGEYKVAEFRDALLGSIRQEFVHPEFPFLWLDPAFSWHGGFTYWHGKFAQVIKQLAKMRGVSFAEARKLLSQRLAAIELIPYHSAKFQERANWTRNLPSAQLARSFVRERVLPRVGGGEAIVIVTRQADVWGVEASDGVVVYDRVEARAAYLTPGSRGGAAILKHMRETQR